MFHYIRFRTPADRTTRRNNKQSDSKTVFFFCFCFCDPLSSDSLSHSWRFCCSLCCLLPIVDCKKPGTTRTSKTLVCSLAHILDKIKNWLSFRPFHGWVHDIIEVFVFGRAPSARAEVWVKPASSDPSPHAHFSQLCVVISKKSKVTAIGWTGCPARWSMTGLLRPHLEPPSKRHKDHHESVACVFNHSCCFRTPSLFFSATSCRDTICIIHSMPHFWNCNEAVLI